ncbi:MAG: sensor histidine kinase, partial [Nitrospiraceae bacterium]
MNAIDHEISTIGPDGLDGVLRRITDGAADLLQADVCLVMLRNDQMGCWIVEAASGEWNDRLHKSVMLWEEFPVSVRAFETGQPAIGEDLRSDLRPEVARRNQIGESMLSIPLRAQGVPFGVLVLLKEKKVASGHWNVRVAKEFADVAAIAMTNARLYEALQQKGKGYESRLRHLEYMAEMLAHDLKAPSQRMEGLASALLSEYGGQLDDRVGRWLHLIEKNGKELAGRVENILNLALVGARHEAIGAVDPSLILHDVLNERAEELAAQGVRVQVDPMFPMVACHGAYLRQIFDNLISNAIKFAGDHVDPQIKVTAQRKDDLVHMSVSDNGGGIPSQHRARVFEPFVRLNHRASGSGIGLTIVKRIVELYGGSVWIDSQEPPGCTITFTLPVLGDLSVPRSIGHLGLATDQESPTA